MKLSAHTDGASKGNPGHAGIGYTIEKDDAVIEEYYDYIGETTNNVAEYKALIAVLNRMKKLGADDVTVYSDSELAVRQINGIYKVKNTGLKHLFTEAVDLINCFASFEIIHLRRENNSHADSLANKAIDEFNSQGKMTN